MRYFIRILLLLCPVLTIGQQVELRDGYFHIDGRKFFVKGIGYEVGATPGQYPWDRTFDPEVMRADMERIIDAGYNTIRTWSAFTSAELDVLDEYDIRIIMGIWIDPHGDFSDPSFVAQARDIVSGVLSYSKNHDNIIAYLIMNEPLPETITAAGYEETVALWRELIDIIHAEHPGRPVTMSNTSNGTWIDAAVFDFSAFNVYIYNPVTVNFLHGYRDFVAYLRDLTPGDRPLILSEYGLSVSPEGPGNWGYGGNSPEEQTEGILYMYQSLVEGGASGSCVFNYSDGWWKSGDAFTHDPYAEEWFGLVEYTGLSDKYGQERPVWDAVKTYQSAIFTQPRSAEIYGTAVPIEVFPSDTIHKIGIRIADTLFHELYPAGAHLADTLRFDMVGMQDVVLDLYCYDGDDNLIKSEEKKILVSPDPVVLPSIDIQIGNPDFWGSGMIHVNYGIAHSPVFESGNTLDYIYYPHIGFSYGEAFQRPLPPDEDLHFTATHYLLEDIQIFTVGAAFDISYGSFQKRIVNQLTRSQAGGVVSGTGQTISNEMDCRIYPNPARQTVVVRRDGPPSTECFDYAVFDLEGKRLRGGKNVPWGEEIQIGQLPPGIYWLYIDTGHRNGVIVKKMIKQ